MSRILGYDLSSDGHHYLYNVTVMRHLKQQGVFEKVGYYTMTENERMVAELMQNGVQVHNFRPRKRPKRRLGIWQRAWFLLLMLVLARKQGYRKVHLFNLDSNVLSLLLTFPFAWGMQMTGTLHWYPTHKLKRGILFMLLRLRILNKIVVHGNYTHQKMLRDGLNESIVANIHVPYFQRHSDEPSRHLQEIRSRFSVRPRPYLLCFGGLRYDKGIDILLESIALLKNYDFTVIIAGSPDHFTEADIDRMADQYGVGDKLFKDIQYIPEQVKSFYLQQCDAVLLPYRSIFAGISGPLTEGTAHQKFIVGPRHGELGYTIETYRLGATFEAENREDLADKLKQVLHRMNGMGKPPMPSQTSLFAQVIHNEKLFGDRYGRFLA